MLRLPQFQFIQARTLNEAASILSTEGEIVRLVAGGTDLWPNMKRRHQKARTVVSLMNIPGLAGFGVNGGVTIGATTLLDDIIRHPVVRERYPAFAAAVQSISSPPLRNMGTIGGNLCVDTRCTYYNQTEDWRQSIDYCMKEEGKICWVATSSPRCWAHTASDSAPMACALGAEVKLVSTAGERVIPVENLYEDDGIRYLTKRPDEILVGLHLPAGSAANRCRSAFWKLRRRGSIDFAVLSVAAAVWMDPAGIVEKARIYLGAVASYPVPAKESADFLVGKPLNEETIAEAAKLARKAATPMDNTDFQTQWRGVMVQRYAEAALRDVAGLDPGRLAPRHAGTVLPVIG
ncbi:MAG TPA: FAD binding domain-containing protein [Thermoanaerobaculia bacterium]|jgi:4-hydroxybenzoyl-CoA reductase subunit beta|nr:FAD binding domain-containing protein [Thermoanaerobaculia bacterium]